MFLYGKQPPLEKQISELINNYLGLLEEKDKCKIMVKYVIPSIKGKAISTNLLYTAVKADAPETPRSEGGFSQGSSVDIKPSF